MYFYGLLSSTQCFYIKLNMHSSISELFVTLDVHLFDTVGFTGSMSSIHLL